VQVSPGNLYITSEPFAKYHRVIREKSPQPGNMAALVNYAVNFGPKGYKITVFYDFWAGLYPLLIFDSL